MPVKESIELIPGIVVFVLRICCQKGKNDHFIEVFKESIELVPYKVFLALLYCMLEYVLRICSKKGKITISTF